jgi:hypothetical protein
VTDVKQGRSSRPKPNPVAAKELKQRTPSQLAAYLGPEAKQAARQARIAALAEGMPRCEWCGEPVLRHVRPHEHDGCDQALAKLPAEGVAHDSFVADVLAATAGHTTVHVAPSQAAAEATVAEARATMAAEPAAVQGPSWTEQVDAREDAWPGRRQYKPAERLADGDIVLDDASGLWRSVLFSEVDEYGTVLAETTRHDGEPWVTLTWQVGEQVTWRRA